MVCHFNYILVNYCKNFLLMILQVMKSQVIAMLQFNTNALSLQVYYKALNMISSYSSLFVVMMACDNQQHLEIIYEFYT